MSSLTLHPAISHIESRGRIRCRSREQADPTALLDYLNLSGRIMKTAKQTGEAADLAVHRVQRHGNIGYAVKEAIDVDEFVSECITYMQGRGIDDDDAVKLQPSHGALGNDKVDMLDWAHLGRFACIPAVRRPALPGFLLGPLSAERQARSAPLGVNNLQEACSKKLRAEDLKNDLPSICGEVFARLRAAEEKAWDAVELERNGLDDDPTPEEERALINRHALRTTGGIDLLRFVVNPHSFGQTVENMFYLSFLIKEGSVGLDFDDDGLPSIGRLFWPATVLQRLTGATAPVQKNSSTEPPRSRAAMRHQAIMSIDMATWRDIVDVFRIKQPMIPHREEAVDNNDVIMNGEGYYVTDALRALTGF